MLLAAALTACSTTPTTPHRAAHLSLTPVPSRASPSPLVQVQVGHVQAVVPKSWQAQMLKGNGVPQEGFVASPKPRQWLRGDSATEGMEMFWLDVDSVGIPSDYYYFAARDAALAGFGQKACPSAPIVVVNHPPNVTGSLSPGDYVARGHGGCQKDGVPLRWGYFVAAPGYGPARAVGIPTSGLYVVMARVSGPRAGLLLKEMLASASFGDSTITQIAAASHQQAGV